TLAGLRKRMGSGAFRDALAVNLSQMMERASKVADDGAKVLDGDRFLAEWRALPEVVRNAYPKAAQRATENLATMGSALQKFGRFANTSIGGEIVESAATPVIAAMFGMHVAVPLVVAKALLN